MTDRPKSSKRSGGPQSDEGKAAVSLNALKGGVYSQLVVLPSENPAHFEELENLFYSDLKVQGLVEHSLARELAVFTWKRMRLERLEQQEMIRRLSRPISPDELSSVGLEIPYSAKGFIDDNDVLDRSTLKTYRQYAKLCREWREAPPNAFVFEKVQEDLPDLYEWFLQEAELLGVVDPISDRFLVTHQGRDGSSELLLFKVIRKVLTTLEAIFWVADHQAEIECARERVRDRRLLDFMRTDGSRRAFDDLARGFRQTLNELRKQQDWRRKNGVIDVSPESIPKEPASAKSSEAENPSTDMLPLTHGATKNQP